MSIEKSLERIEQLILLSSKDTLTSLERIEQLTLLSAKDALTMDDAVAYTGLSKTYLYRLVHLKKIPYFKSEGGKYTYFAKKELCDWLLRYRVQTAKEAKEAKEAASWQPNVNN